ncbi:MAG TPA: DUF2130 domain-containing protein [Ignavibacteria bacterium]|nr:DUF2130 domain-containing protein [Bacteroidota bacterium]HRI85407.1 DUF2130 domain-containing protein [Ignavibacteria bacterium]HRK00247.1 DUF2130 domain-containing protein [Ignavibacteria bacterium]
MANTKINCPNCGVDIDVDEVFKQKAEEDIRKSYDEKLSKQVGILNKKKEEVDAEKLRIKKLIEEQDDIIRTKLIEEREKVKKEAEFTAKRELEFELIKLKQDIDAKSKENRQYKLKEVDVLNKEKELKEKEEQMKLDMKRKMLQMESEIQEKAVKAEQERNEIRMMEYDRQLEEQKKQLNEMKKKEVEFINKEQELRDREEQLKLDMEKQMIDKSKMIEEKIIKREQEKSEIRKQEYEKLLEEQKNELSEMKKKEIDFKNKEQELRKKEEQLKLDMERQLAESLNAIEEKTIRREQEKNELKNREYEKQLEDQKKMIDELKKKSEQGSLQLQGEIQELAIEDFLRNAFPFDKITEVKKGEKGADAIQTVINNFQQECGKIIYESKRTKAFSDNWIVKLKEDQIKQQADIAVIVTETMPKDLDRFGQKHGVWICNFSEVKSLSLVLREMLLRTHTVKTVNENRGDKMEMLYSYLTSSEFRQQVESIVEGFTSMQNDLNKEKIAMEKIWSSREKQIRKVLINTSSMFGSIKGLAGSSIQEIKALEMPEDE